MFSKVRTSLKAGSRSRRRTLRSQKGGAVLVSFPSDSTDTTQQVKPKDSLADRKTMWEQVLPDSLKPFLSGITATNYISLIENQDKLFECAMEAAYKKLEIKGIQGKKDETAEETDAQTQQTEILSKFYALADADPKIQTCYEYLFDVARAIYLGDRTKTTTTTKLEQIEGKDEQFLEFLLNPLRAQNMFIQFLASVIKMQKDKKVLEIITSQTTDHQVGAINIRAQTYASDAECNSQRATTMPLRDGFYLMQAVTEVDKVIAVRTDTNKTTGFWNKFVGHCVKPPTAEVVSRKINEKLLDADTFSILAAFIFAKYVEVGVATLKQTIFESLKGESADPATIDATVIPNNPESIPVVGTIMLGTVLKAMRMEHVHFIVHLVATLGRLEGVEPTAAPAAAPAATATNLPPETDKITNIVTTAESNSSDTAEKKADNIFKIIISNKPPVVTSVPQKIANFRFALSIIKNQDVLTAFLAKVNRYLKSSNKDITAVKSTATNITGLTSPTVGSLTLVDNTLKYTEPAAGAPSPTAAEGVAPAPTVPEAAAAEGAKPPTPAAVVAAPAANQAPAAVAPAAPAAAVAAAVVAAPAAAQQPQEPAATVVPS